MGCSLQWIKDRDAVSEVTNQSYKYPKIDGGPVCDFHNHEGKIFDINTSPGRQYEYSFLRDKNGTYPQQTSLDISKSQSVIQADHNYCTRNAETKAEWRLFPIDSGRTESELICIETMPSASSIYA